GIGAEDEILEGVLLRVDAGVHDGARAARARAASGDRDRRSAEARRDVRAGETTQVQRRAGGNRVTGSRRAEGGEASDANGAGIDRGGGAEGVGGREDERAGAGLDQPVAATVDRAADRERSGV